MKLPWLGLRQDVRALRKLRWNLKGGPLQTTALFKGLLFKFHVSLSSVETVVTSVLETNLHVQFMTGKGQE